MKQTKYFHYPPSTRSTTDGLRTYDVGNEKLPSVTTILGATKSQDSKQSIANWQAKVGMEQATRIRDQAASRGTNMHKHLEAHVMGAGHLDLTPEGKIAKAMADVIIAKGFKDLQEIWGSEVVVYYPGLYAGATDVVGVYDYEDSIIDFKQSNKPKRKEWIEDYFLQGSAYAMAHNEMFGTDIKTIVIMMCTHDGKYLEFVIEQDEFDEYISKWLDKLKEYYKVFDKYQ